VEVAQPHQGVVDDVSANLLRAGSIEVHHFTPRVALRGQVGPEASQVVAARPEMVVDDVEEYRESLRMAGVDEAFQPVRAAVGFVHRIPVDAVVTPVPYPVEGVHR